MLKLLGMTTPFYVTRQTANGGIASYTFNTLGILAAIFVVWLNIMVWGSIGIWQAITLVF